MCTSVCFQGSPFYSDYDRVNITRTLSQIDNPSCVETISITTQADSVVEAEETFLISLSSESFIVTIDNQDLQVTIEDTDSEISMANT